MIKAITVLNQALQTFLDSAINDSGIPGDLNGDGKVSMTQDGELKLKQKLFQPAE